MKKIFSILCFIQVVLSAQTPSEPPHWSELGIVKNTFVAIYTIPQFQTGEKGFQEWIKFELNDYKTIQNLIKNGDLIVNWTAFRQNMDIKTSDSTVKYEIERVFKKMPVWKADLRGWKNISSKDTIFVDDSRKEFYRFQLPEETFLFRYVLTDSLTYQFESKNFSDTIQVTGGRYGFPVNFGEIYYSILYQDLASDFGVLLKKEVNKRFLLRKIPKLLQLKEMDITVNIKYGIQVYVNASTKRGKRMGNKLAKLIQEQWKSWRLYKYSTTPTIQLRIKPDLSVWIY